MTQKREIHYTKSEKAKIIYLSNKHGFIPQSDAEIIAEAIDDLTFSMLDSLKMALTIIAKGKKNWDDPFPL